MNNVKLNKKNYRSLRSVLVIWFFLFSIIPLAFVSWYSLVKFEKAIDNELSQRLDGNGREIEVMIADYYSAFTTSRDNYLKNPHLIYNLSVSDSAAIKEMSLSWLATDIATSLTFYDREGRMLSSVFRDDKNTIRTFETNSARILLNEKYLSHLKQKSSLGIADYPNSNKISLILCSKVLSTSGKIVGYIEQSIDLKDQFLNKIKSKLKLEAFIVRDSGQVISATQKEFKNISKDRIFRLLQNSGVEKFFDINTEIQPYGFILYPISWDKSRFYIALGTSKTEAQSVLKNVNIAFLSVIGVVAVFLIITILVSTNWFLKPINELIRGLRTFERTDSLVQLPVKNNTEIGQLTVAFNEMSLKIYQTRSDLKKKLKELELANSELKEAQTKLVHSAKMTSLGQLVAGVAHELNNPIGFIYSNTAHLTEYSEKLFQLIEGIKNKPDDFEKLKKELDYEFIKVDLPRLIKSCQDGAQRTKDIVLGLRNFSRLEEAQLKEIDITEAIDTTLELLHGEIKNRIKIHKQYEPVPKVMCYASQINQVIMNILSNAVQAIPAAGEIWISTLPLKASSDSVGRVQISVQDTGAGMDADVLEKIFEPFFTTKGVGQGTGLGLSISYGIIQNHGGEIQVRSQKNIGTEFTIIIPITPPKRA